jgi:peptidoglycan glycosyltransferase
VERSWTPPQTQVPIFNFGGSACGGTLFQVMEVSCNTAFARMGTETIGPDEMVRGTAAWGFNDAPPIDLPAPARSVFPTNFTRDLPKLAQSSIGQNDVQATPLQMALVAAAVANGGRMMRPHVMSEVRDANQQVVSRFAPSTWKQPLTPEHAATIRDAMIGVVRSGTARALAIPGYEVGGKTGTAQLGTEPPRSHTWIIGFGGPPGDPQVAVAVVVLDQPGASEFTGGRVAAPIARAVLQQALAVKAGG